MIPHAADTRNITTKALGIPTEHELANELKEIIISAINDAANKGLYSVDVQAYSQYTKAVSYYAWELRNLGYAVIVENSRQEGNPQCTISIDWSK